MAWVTWRQHRLQLLVGAALLGAVALAVLISGLPIRTAYHRHALATCLPPTTRSGCDLIVHHFTSEFANSVRAVRYLALVPAFIGVFVGAPLLAREFEQGTFRLAWTQTITKQRWLMSKTALLGLATVAGGLTLSALAMWWRRPFDNLDGRMTPSAFEIEGLVVPAYALFALAAGVLGGALLRRTIAASCAALGAFVALRLVVAKILRPHFLPAKHESVSGLTPAAHARDWVLDNSLVDAVGRHISTAREDLAILHAQHGRIDAADYLLSLGWRRDVTFQPAGRFWAFQSIEAAIFAVAALIAFALAVRLVQRRGS
jgi:hypothetical protein